MKGIQEEGDDAVSDMREKDEMIKQVEARDLIEFGEYGHKHCLTEGRSMNISHPFHYLFLVYRAQYSEFRECFWQTVFIKGTNSSLIIAFQNAGIVYDIIIKYHYQTTVKLCIPL